MKRIFLTISLVISVLTLNASHTFCTSSRLASGNIVKLRVDKNGIYMVTYDEIKSWGLNPETTGVLGFGGGLLSQNFTLKKIDDLPIVPVFRSKGQDGVFNSGDYILFYAQGAVSWSYSGEFFSHTQNHCSSYGYYFLSDAPDALEEISPIPFLDDQDALPVRTYTYYDVHEKDLINLIDERGQFGGGREFYGEKMENHVPSIIDFHIPQVDTNQKMACRVNAAAQSVAVIPSYTLAMQDVTKQMMLSAIENGDFYTEATTNQTTLMDITPASHVTLSMTFNSDQSAAVGFLNYVEINAPCELRLQGNSLLFRYAVNYEEGESRHNLYKITGADVSTQIWDISQLDKIQLIPTSWDKDTLCFVGDNLSIHEYVAVRTDATDFMRPAMVGKINNQNLHELTNIDYVIVTPAEFRAEAERLAEAHWQKDGLTYAVVTDQEVYNEFSSGTPDVSAIRWFMKMFYDRAEQGTSTAPRYLLLFGDGSFDNRKLLPHSAPNTLITYQAINSTVETKAYASDDYFAFLDDKDGLVGSYYSDIYGIMRIGVGRLPVNTQEEARNVVNKLIAYMDNSQLGDWKHQLCFLADDGDHGQHTTISDLAAELVRQKEPKFVVNKVYLDAYPQEKTASTESYPLAYNRFTNLLRTGVLLMDYSGHGSANNICNELFLTLASVQQMSNKNQGFWMLATCNYARYDQTALSSAEAAVLNPNGGAIGVLSACRTVYASENSVLNQNICDTLFAHHSPYDYYMRLGDAVSCAKNKCGKSENKISYAFLGDPALRLNYPTDMEVVSIPETDTLHALEVVTLSGYIRDEAGDTVHDFNGLIDIAVYDKLQQITTRDNDETQEKKKVHYTYNDYSNLLFCGNTEVEEGLFSIEFRMPKDIHYNFGSGRIVYCAYDSENQWEAVGYDHNITIGGSDTAAIHIQDTIGPNLHIYLDNPAFQDGGKTSQYPHFYADIDDEIGINMVGNGIGHDLLLIVDNDTKQTYSLNEYYHARQGSYQSGQVSYAMPLQQEGQHFLTFRAWDILNNSSSASFSYQVVNGLSPVLYSVSTYPNPCTPANLVSIAISTDRPDEILQTEVAVYSLGGQKSFSINYDELRTIQFRPADYHMTPGIYIIKLNINTSTSGTASTIGKLIVL